MSSEPAFPRNDDAPGHNGMTLRDYFAAKAMQAQLLHPLVQEGEGTRSDVAAASYQMADAMLAARSAT